MLPVPRALRGAAPIALAALLAAPTLALGAGTQPVDKTVALSCGFPLESKPVSLRIAGQVPASTKQGEFLSLTGLTSTVTFPATGGSVPAPSEPAPSVYLHALGVLATGGENQSLFVSSGGPTINTITPVAPASWASTSGLGAEGNTYFIGGAGPVTLAASQFAFNFTTVNSGPGSQGLSVACEVEGGPVTLATLTNGVAAPAGPPTLALSSATPSQGIFSDVGGWVRLRGTNLTGVRTITVGDKTVRPQMVGPSRILFKAPPMPEGTYPVTVARADGTASAPDENVTVTYYSASSALAQ
ncbi:MAG: IPT/TIG domain-containing protein [Solirubrobacteraceae bacterium]|nr:IPT/TIG domain-containing protein [Solirubrobacteraceae bacterium]